MAFDEETTITTAYGAEPLPVSALPSVSLLICHRHGVQGVELSPAQPLVIGRATPSDIVVRDPTLSRQHAKFQLVDGEVWVEDLSSTNGTRINGKTIEKETLRVNDEVTLGSVVISLHVITSTDGQLHGLDSHDRFLHALEEEVVRAKTFSRSVALVMVRELKRDEGRLHRWCPRVRELLRPVDRMGLYGRSAVELLLPEATQIQAEELARIIVGGRRSGEPALVCGVATYPNSAASSEELLEVSRNAVIQAGQEQPVAIAAPINQRPAAPVVPTEDHSDWLVRSAAMVEVRRTVERLSRSAIPVLIFGETGTGKEVIARAIHYGGDRQDAPLRCINCGAIPESLVESVLFGHERGAFTGADRRAKGVFEEASGGTVLLDEIGELAPPAQSALLRVLETKRITRVGASKETAVDVRILAATHRDLEKMCEQSSFRWDLLYRLNTMTLKIPPLRDRVEEIGALAEFFMRQAASANGCDVHAIDEAALNVLERYPWPGNVRELRNVIERAVVIADGPVITTDDLSDRVRQAVPEEEPNGQRKRRPTISSDPDMISGDVDVDGADGDARTARHLRGGTIDFKTRMQQFEVSLIRQALTKTENNKTEAATLLGMPRRTLIYKLKAAEDEEDDWSDFSGTVLETHRLGEDGLDFKTRVQKYEAQLIREALRAARGNQAEAARLLRMPSRTLTYKVREYGLK